MAKQKVNFNINLGAPGFILFCIFLVLKLTKTITWSWLWVTAPLWIPLSIAGCFFFIWFVLVVFVAVAKTKGW